MSKLLLYVQVPFYRTADKVFIEAQAANVIKHWSRNFQYITLVAPECMGAVPGGWIPWEDIGEATNRVELFTIPSAYSPLTFVKKLPAGYKKIRVLRARLRG